MAQEFLAEAYGIICLPSCEQSRQCNMVMFKSWVAQMTVHFSRSATVLILDNLRQFLGGEEFLEHFLEIAVLWSHLMICNIKYIDRVGMLCKVFEYAVNEFPLSVDENVVDHRLYVPTLTNSQLSTMDGTANGQMGPAFHGQMHPGFAMGPMVPYGMYNPNFMQGGGNWQHMKGGKGKGKNGRRQKGKGKTKEAPTVPKAEGVPAVAGDAAHHPADAGWEEKKMREGPQHDKENKEDPKEPVTPRATTEICDAPWWNPQSHRALTVRSLIGAHRAMMEGNLLATAPDCRHWYAVCTVARDPVLYEVMSKKILAQTCEVPRSPGNDPQLVGPEVPPTTSPKRAAATEATTPKTKKVKKGKLGSVKKGDTEGAVELAKPAVEETPAVVPKAVAEKIDTKDI